MNFYLLFTTILVFLFGVLLYFGKWKLKHIVSFVLSILFVYLFSEYGYQLLSPIWKGANAADFWLIVFFVIYVGGAIIGTLPFIIDGIQKGEKKKLWNIFKFWIVLGLIYVAVDNVTMGPFAVGLNSPYISYGSLCHLNPTFYAEDVWAGCIYERFGGNPFGSQANFLVYVVFTMLLALIAILIVGYKRFEKLIFVEK